MKSVHVVIAILVISLFIPGLALAGGDPPAPKGFKITPILQSVTQTSVGVMWETHNADAGVVKIATNRYMNGAVSYSGGSSSKRHKVRVTGLTPNTLYYYQVTADGETSARGSFVTALAKGQRMPIRFIVYGDSRLAPWYEDIIAKYGDNDDHLPVCVSMANYSPDFVVHVGDFVFDGNDKDAIYNFFDVEKELLANHPIIPTYGNHEFKGGSGASNTLMDSFLIPLPGGTFSYYALTYGNIRIIVLNTGEGVFAKDDYSLLAPGSPQWNWAEAQCRDAVQDPDIDHIFISMHAPPYSCANFGDNKSLINAIESLTNRYHVTAVFMGHEHDYQHLSKWGQHYILSGGAGSSVMDYPWKGDQNDTSANLIKYDNVLNYVIVDVVGSTASFQARKVQGNGNSSSSVLESFTLQGMVNQG